MAQFVEGLFDGRFVVLVMVVTVFSLIMQSMYRRYFPSKTAPYIGLALETRILRIQQDLDHLRDAYAHLIDQHRQLEQLVINTNLPPMRTVSVAPLTFADMDEQLRLLNEQLVPPKQAPDRASKEPRPTQWDRVAQDEDHEPV